MNELDFVDEYRRIRDDNNLSDPEFKLRCPASSAPILYSVFYGTYNRYIQALNHDIQMLRRHVRSLRAWRDVELSHSSEVKGSVWACILIDYIEPTVRSAIDLPKEINEKVYQGAWKLSVIAQRGAQGAALVAGFEGKRQNKYQLLDTYGTRGRALDRLKECLAKLYGKEQFEAKELERLHGEKHHDILSPVHDVYPCVKVEEDASLGMLTISHTYDRLDWHSLISTIDCQREFAQDAYWAFLDYVEELIGSGLQIG